MLALPVGNGDWAKTVEGYDPACSLTLRLEQGGGVLDTQTVTAQYVFGECSWVATLYAFWDTMPINPPFYTLYWLLTLKFVRSTIVIWSDTVDGFVVSPNVPPAFVEFDFAAAFTGAVLTDRNTYDPVRGVYVQHFEEIDPCEGRWYIDKDDVATAASLGALSKSYVAGTAFLADEQTTGAMLALGFDWVAGSGQGKLNTITVDGHAVPCGGLNELGGDAVGSGSDITCKNQDWSGTIYAPINVLYHCPDAEVDGRVLSPVCKMGANGALAPYAGVPVVDSLITARDAVPSVPSENFHGFDSGLLWRLSGSGGTWASSPTWADSWLKGDRALAFPILPAWAAAGGAEEDEKDDDLTICLRGYPLDERAPTVGRVEALAFAHEGAQEVEFPEGAGTRRSPWVGSGPDITVTNGAASTRIEAAGAGSAERDLENYWPTRIGASAMHWDEVPILKPTDPAEDFWNWSNYGALAVDITMDWTAAADRDFELLVTYESYDVLADDHNANPALRVFVLGAATVHTALYYIHIPLADKALPITVLVDLAFPVGAASIPRLFRVTNLKWQSLVDGDDFTFTSMELLPEDDNGNDSARLQLSFPDSKDAGDRFGCAGLVSGQLTFDETDDGEAQGGVQVGVAHSYPLYNGGDVSELRVIEEAAGPYGLVDLLKYQQGWTAAAVALGNALEDADGNVLIGPAMMLLEEQFDTPAGSLYLSPRFASYVVPYGATYYARPHKILRGAFHGLGYTAGRAERATPGINVETMLCVGGVPGPTLVDVALTDEWGHYCTAGLFEELAYHVREAAGCYQTVNVERRWVEALIAMTARWDPASWCEFAGRWFQVFVRNGRVWFHQRPNPQTVWEPDIQVTAATGWSDPSIGVLPDGQLVVTAHNVVGGVSRVHNSFDDGATWLEGSDMALAKVALAERHGILHAVGVEGVSAKHCYSEDAGASWSAAMAIAASDDEQPAIAFLTTAELVATLTQGGVMTDYVSRDYGGTWSAI